MPIKQIQTFLKNESLFVGDMYLQFLQSEYLRQISKTVFVDNHEWQINRIERPFTMDQFISDEFDSIDSCLQYFGSKKSISMLMSKFFYEHSELIYQWKEFMKFHPIFRKGFLIIGLLDSPHSSILLIGIQHKNIGEIWMNIGNSDTIIKVANNINDFNSKLVFKPYSILVDRFNIDFVKDSRGFYRVKTK